MELTPEEKQNDWISVDVRLPIEEGYYAVKYSDGFEDEKPFRIRPSKNIRGFMTMNQVTHWKPLIDSGYEEIDDGSTISEGAAPTN